MDTPQEYIPLSTQNTQQDYPYEERSHKHSRSSHRHRSRHHDDRRRSGSRERKRHRRHRSRSRSRDRRSRKHSHSPSPPPKEKKKRRTFFDVTPEQMAELTGYTSLGPMGVPFSYSQMDSPNKLFIGGIPAQTTEPQVRQLLETFGKLKSFNLVKDSTTGMSKGYAFCEYHDEKVTEEAIKGLNGMELGNKKLLVKRALDGKQTTMPIVPMNVQNLKGLDPIAQLLNPGVKVETALSAVASAQGGLLLSQPTKILVLLNMLHPHELYLTDEEHQELVEDVESECRKYGKIVNIVIPRLPKKPKDDEIVEIPKGSGVGKVFIEYETREQAQKAQQELAGRKFQGRIVITSFHPESLFYNKKY